MRLRLRSPIVRRRSLDSVAFRVEDEGWHRGLEDTLMVLLRDQLDPYNPCHDKVRMWVLEQAEVFLGQQVIERWRAREDFTDAMLKDPRL